MRPTDTTPTTDGTRPAAEAARPADDRARPAAETARPVGDHDVALLEQRYGAPNYAPLDVTLRAGDGAWVTDVHGVRHLDLLAAYSAVNFGHGHPRLLDAARRQLDTLTLTSRAFRSDQLGPFCRDLAELVGPHLAGEPMVLPMNTGAEAVESAIKAARRWGHTVRGVPDGTATIVVAAGNFHGRTTTIVSFSDDPAARDGFGPYTPGFRTVPYGDAAAVADAIDETTVAVLLEPVQGEAGVVVPPAGHLAEVRAITAQRDVLLVCDEIQSGLGRTGRTLAVQHAGTPSRPVRPDLVILGKALGGGIVPVSAVVGRADVLGVLGPGRHGSTFGGSPLACAIGREVVAMLATGEWQQRAARLGEHLADLLAPLVGDGLDAVRTLGPWAGLDVTVSHGTGRAVCERLLERRVLAKDAHGQTIRLAPPLVVTEDELDWAVEQLTDALRAA